FGKTLSLKAGDQAYAMLPGEAVEGEESLSITGWVNLTSEQPGQLFFDFGKDGRNHFFLAPFGTGELAGFHVGFIRDASLVYTTASPDYKLETDQWVHLALVLDIPSKTISTYVNGERVGNTENVDLELNQFFTHENKLYIGRSLNHGSPFLDARVRDFRIYRIPLEESQIARIRYNALRRGQGSGPRERPVDNLPQFGPDTPQLYHEFLIAVSDVAVET